MDQEIDLRALDMKTLALQKQSSVELEKHLFIILEQGSNHFFIHLSL